MASYTDKHKEAVKEIIEEYANKTLDNYTLNTITNVAFAKMNAKATEQEVADAVFDCIKKDFSGDIVQATMCQQILPTSVLYVLRNEIIKTLKNIK